MNLTDEEIEILDALICDANEEEFEEFTNNLTSFAVDFTPYMQDSIAKNIRKLFSDRFFVYLVNRYAIMKRNNDATLVLSIKHAAIKDFIIEFMYAEKLVD